ncbi:MAG TPA: DUF4956 domain-containing protein [Vicinamibacteria bacterium]|nr:DUF4956 domain-containing protein [Vicinamibacteria bacterium]
MSIEATTPPVPGRDRRLRPIRLLAYYALLILFIVLMRHLLSELGRQYNLEGFTKIKEIVKLAVNYTSTFDDVVHTVFSLFLSFVFTLPLGWVYTMTKEQDEYDVSLVQTLVALSMAVTGVMIVIGNELARAFSLAGVVAAVRFRNTLDDAKDTVYIFVAIAIGMACGARQYAIATWLSMIMTATMYALWRSRFGERLMRAGGRKKGGAELAWVRDEGAVQAAQHSLEQQVRLLQWASAPSKDKKKLNCALVVDASDLDAAQLHMDASLGALGGRWRLSGITANGRQGVLEYVGRLPKNTTAAALVAALRAGSPPAIDAIEFRSLKGLRAKPAAAPDED